LGSTVASKPIILIKKKKALSSSIFPHRRSSPSASNLASHPSTPPLPQIHHPTIACLVLSPLPVRAWAFLGLTASVVTKTLSFSCAISAFTNQKQENEKLYIKQEKKKKGTWVSFFSSFFAASAKHLLLAFSPSSFSLCVSGFLLGFFLVWFPTIISLLFFSYNLLPVLLVSLYGLSSLALICLFKQSYPGA